MCDWDMQDTSIEAQHSHVIFQQFEMRETPGMPQSFRATALGFFGSFGRSPAIAPHIVSEPKEGVSG